MIKKKQKQLIEVFAYVAICLILFTIPLIDSEGQGVLLDHRTYNSWIRISVFILLFLLNSYVFVPQLLFKKERILYIVILIAFISLLTILWELFMPLWDVNKSLMDTIPPPNDRIGPSDMMHRPPPKPIGPGRPVMLFNNILISILVIGLSTALRVTQKWIQDEKSLRELEKEHLSSELSFLKNQLSPHFFLNTLNNIHSLIDVDKKNAQKAIIELSTMMRYLLYESDKGLSKLTKEIAFIRNYIDLMKLRMDEKVSLSIDLPEEITEVKIPPLLFISFIENAFKHGISYKQASFVKISLMQSETTLVFSCVNSNHQQKERLDDVSGIGLRNIKKRLDLLYAEKYDLAIQEDLETYSVQLKIPLS
jgi:hypothetical protein